MAGAEAGEGPAFRRGPGGSAQRRVGGTHREEILVGMREGGVPVKSWLLITAALGLGLYRLFGMLREPDRARSPGKRGSPERRRRMAGRSTGRESGEEALASIPQEWLEGGGGGGRSQPEAREEGRTEAEIPQKDAPGGARCRRGARRRRRLVRRGRG